MSKYTVDGKHRSSRHVLFLFKYAVSFRISFDTVVFLCGRKYSIKLLIHFANRTLE